MTLFPFLYIGVTVPVSQSSGNVCRTKELVINIERGTAKPSQQYFKTLELIPSGPGATSIFSLLSKLFTFSGLNETLAQEPTPAGTVKAGKQPLGSSELSSLYKFYFCLIVFYFCKLVK